MRKINLENFIIKSNEVHNNKYDYSLVEYINCKTKIKINCHLHGVFEQTPDSHLHSHGCPICGKENTKKKQLKFLNQFIISANKIHNNKYNYSLSHYLGSRKKLSILCPKHGSFGQTPDSHLRGSGCPKCVNRNTTTIEFIEKANLVHNFRYNYKLVEYVNPKTKILIICEKHGSFEQIPNSHLCGRGCPICKSSKGELKILKFLQSKNIHFIREKKFFDCKNKYRLPFDFYLPDYNTLIEYDGKQHEQPVNFYGISNTVAQQNFLKLMKNDEIKNNYAKNNNIKMIRVSHNEKNIEEYLKNNIDIDIINHT